MKDGAFIKNIQIYRKGHLPKLLLTKVTIYPKSFDRNCHLPKWLFTQKIYTQISFTEKAVTEVDYTHRTAHALAQCHCTLGILQEKIIFIGMILDTCSYNRQQNLI